MIKEDFKIKMMPEDHAIDFLQEDFQSLFVSFTHAIALPEEEPESNVREELNVKTAVAHSQSLIEGENIWPDLHPDDHLRIERYIMSHPKEWF